MGATFLFFFITFSCVDYGQKYYQAIESVALVTAGVPLSTGADGSFDVGFARAVSVQHMHTSYPFGIALVWCCSLLFGVCNEGMDGWGRIQKDR